MLYTIVCTLQIWDFASAEKIKDVPPEPMNDSLVRNHYMYLPSPFLAIELASI